MKQIILCTIIVAQLSSTQLAAMEVNYQALAIKQKMTHPLQHLAKKIANEDIETCREELLPLIKKETQHKVHLLTTNNKHNSPIKTPAEPSPLFKELSLEYLRSVYFPTENRSDSLYNYLSSEEGNSSNVDSMLSEGQTLLMCAVRKNHEPMITLLLSKKADPNITLKNGYSALMFAIDNKQVAKGNIYVAKGNIYIVELLLNAGADTNAKEPFLGTALDLAIARENTELVTLLLAYVDEKICGKGLITAIQIESEPLARLLLRNSKELSHLRSAYDKAKFKKNYQLCVLLLSHGALGTKKSILHHVRFKEIKDRSGKTLFETAEKTGKYPKHTQ